MIHINVKGRHLTAVSDEPLVAKTVGVVMFEAEFDASWEGYRRKIVFSGNAGDAPVWYTGGVMEVPWQAMDAPGLFRISAVGLAEGKREVSAKMDNPLYINPNGSLGEDPADPGNAPSILEQTQMACMQAAEDSRAAQKQAEDMANAALLSKKTAEQFAAQAGEDAKEAKLSMDLALKAEHDAGLFAGQSQEAAAGALVSKEAAEDAERRAKAHEVASGGSADKAKDEADRAARERRLAEQALAETKETIAKGEPDIAKLYAALVRDTLTGSIVQGDFVAGTPLDYRIDIEARQEGDGEPSPENVRPISGSGYVHLGINDQAHTINWGDVLDLPETSCGGYIDWGRCKYVQTHKIIRFSDINFVVAENDGYPVGNSLFFRAVIKGNDINIREFLCSKIPFNNSALRDDITGGYILLNNLYCRIKGVSDLKTFNSLIEGIEFVVTLSEPIDHDISIPEGFPTAGKTYIRAFQAGVGTPSPENVMPILGVDKISVPCYGGYIDFKHVKYVQTHRKIVFDGSENWTNSKTKQLTYTIALNDAMLVGASNSNYIAASSSHYNSDCWAKMVNDGVALIWGTGIGICDKSKATVDDFKEYLAEQYAAGTPVTVVYELETPIEYDLPDLPTLTALDGITTVCSDAAGVTVTGYMDTKAYIDKKIAELTALALEV